jgi:hypothetical protein
VTEIRNLTGGPLAVYLTHGPGIDFPNEPASYCAATRDQPLGWLDGIPLVAREFTPPRGMPAPRHGVYYIVPFSQRACMADRPDVLVPHDLVRNDQNEVVGCRAFAIADNLQLTPVRSGGVVPEGFRFGDVDNYTPHCVTAYWPDNSTSDLESSGLARCEEEVRRAGDLDGIPLVEKRYGAVVGLPIPQFGRLCVVSFYVRAAEPARTDLLVPHDEVRDASGHIIGCRAFSVSDNLSLSPSWRLPPQPGQAAH